MKLYPKNPNLRKIEEAVRDGSRGIILEGGSRSGKTWAVVFFLFEYCAGNNGKVINIIKETYNGFKTTIYDDFTKAFDMMGLPSPFAETRDVPSFRLFGNKINFIGADQPSKFHGAGCDVFYINEALDVRQTIFEQLEMRCRHFWIMDFNPKCSEHWIFNRIGKRDDVVFFHSTLLDNPAIGPWEKKKILSYEPTPANIESGTADDYMWKVYGLGLRASPQGVVFQHVTWIDTFPDNIERIAYGMDFGYTNSPTAIVKVGKEGENIYIQKLFYTPMDNAADLAKVIEQLDIGDSYIWADSADPGMIADLRLKGIRCFAVGKFPGSIKYGIDLMKQHKIHAVRDADMRREFENYKWREINGIKLNDPVDDFNHAIDGARYVCLMEFRKNT